MRVLVSLLVLCMVVAGCSTTAPYADDATVAAVSYRDSGPRELKLLTMINNNSGQGAHSAILINGPERILFDPAGTFEYDPLPERNDVLFGITPQAEQIYLSAHARKTHHVLIQKIELSPEQARIAYNAALNWGATPSAYCTKSTSGLLAQIPGFESIESTFYPRRLALQLAGYPGVVQDRYYEGDDVDFKEAVARLQSEFDEEAASD